MKLKHIILLIILIPAGIFIAQQRKEKSMASLSDSTLWRKIDSLSKVSMPLQAQPFLDEIKHRAVKTRNTSMAVKALIYNMKLNNQRTEDALISFIENLEKETATAWEPLCQITHSMLGEMYQAYYEQNRYRLLNESGMEEATPKGWSHDQVINKIIHHYRASLTNEEMLQASKIDQYKNILLASEHSTKLHSSLFDFLAFRAIDALQHSEYDVIRPMQEYVPEDPRLWLPAKDFATLSLEPATDTLNPQREAILTMQKLIQTKLTNAKDKESIYKTERNRLNRLRNIYQGEHGDSLYWHALLQLISQKPDSDTEALLMTDQANFLIDPSQNLIKGEGKDHPSNKALELAESCIKRYPKSNGACYAHNIKESILQKELSIIGEEIILPGEKIPFQITYRNLQTIFLNIYRLTPQQFEQFNQSPDSLVLTISKLKPISSSKVSLPDFLDHQQHTAHYEAIPQEIGLYIASFSTKETMGNADQLSYFSPFQVTELSAQSCRENNDTIKIKVIHRKSGAPIPNAQVSLVLHNNKWDKKKKTTSEKSLTNQQGEIRFAVSNEHGGYKLTIENNKDQYIVPNHWSYYNQNDESDRTKTIFFTDRKIYRPGQTIHFKSISITGKKNTWHTIPNRSNSIILRDANGSEQGKLSVRTNIFGSAWGSFTIPQGSLNGEWTLQNEDGTLLFSVEEYKRPKFEISFFPINEVVMPGEKATIAGQAVAYAGNRISGAKVHYKVIRNNPYLYRMAKKREQVMATDTTTTNEDGKFEFSFIANPDNNRKNPNTSENYQVFVTVTDLNGEMREAETNFQTTNTGISATLTGDTQCINTDSVILPYRIVNANQQPAKWEATLKIERLQRKAPLRPIAYWAKPDTILGTLTSLDFESGSLWSVHKTVLKKNILLEGTGSINLQNEIQMEPGVYRAQLSGQDNLGKPMECSHRFVILDGIQKKTNHDAEAILLKVINKEINSGDTIQFIAASALKNAIAQLTIQFDNGNIQYRTITLDANQKIETLMIPNGAVETGELSMIIILNNRKYETSQRFSILHPERTLTPELTSWRNKTKPGSNENWTLKILRNGRPSSQTEIVATMYDASLDAYAANNWYFSAFNNWFQPRRSTTNGFNSCYGTANNTLTANYRNCIEENYPMLNWFGYSFGSNRLYGFSDATMLKRSSAKNSANEEVFFIVEDNDVENTTLPEAKVAMSDTDQQTIRKDFSETAFFYPSLTTDEQGETKINFILPDNVTTYKFMALAHTQDGAWGKTTNRLMVQKELMVQPNIPLFLREGDEITITTKIVSLSSINQKGMCNLTIEDAYSGKPLSIIAMPKDQTFDLKAGETIQQNWKITVPSNVEAVKMQITAKTDNHTDGETHVIPILPRRIPVSESAPFILFEAGKQTVTFPGFEAHQGSKTMVFNYSTATASEILKSLPLLMDYPYQSSEQIFNRYFGYAVGMLLSKEQSVSTLLNQWKTEQLNNKNTLQSPLLQNESLKNITLKETPWVAEAEGETQLRERLLELLNPAQVSNTMSQTIDKLSDMQLSNGAFPWFEGMYPSRYITQHIVAGFGWLSRIKTQTENSKADKIVKNSIKYLENELNNDYKQWQKDTSKIKTVDYNTLHLLYALSFHKSGNYNPSVQPFIESIKENWSQQQPYSQILSAIVLNRAKETAAAQQIVHSLTENLVREGAHLAYTKSQGYHWYNNTLETQALLIQAINEIEPENIASMALRNWLIMQKRTQSWPTTKATAMAVFAVLQAPQLLTASADAIKVANRNAICSPTEPAISLIFKNDEVNNSAAKARIEKKNSVPSFGSWHYFYFENSDRVKPHQNSELAIKRDLYTVQSTNSGNKLTPIEKETIKRGDKIRVRLTITAGNPMEYLHIHDQRAAGLEPNIQLSGYRHNRGLGYYQTMHDASADFFIDLLPKGTWTIEYDLNAVQAGKMSQGYANIECLYAPEMKAHSEGKMIKIEQ